MMNERGRLRGELRCRRRHQDAPGVEEAELELERKRENKRAMNRLKSEKFKSCRSSRVGEAVRQSLPMTRDFETDAPWPDAV